MKTFKAQSPEWLEMRRNFITGTEVAVLFGLNKYRNVKDLYTDKFVEPLPFTDTSFVKIGRMLEPLVLGTIGAKLADTGDTVKVYFDEKARISVSLDGMFGEYPVECKTMFKTTFYKTNKSKIPEYYLLQLLMQMRLLKVDIGYFVVMLYSSEDLETALANRSFSSDFDIFPLTIFPPMLFEVSGVTTKIHEIIDLEVNRFFKDPANFEVSKDLKKQMKLLLSKIKVDQYE
jgi:putative phage-type endonuclease